MGEPGGSSTKLHGAGPRAPAVESDSSTLRVGEGRLELTLRVVNWNVEWATPRSRRTAEFLSRIDRHSPEIVCLTETHVRLMSHRGHAIYSQADAGYKLDVNRRKVVLWSREPWSQVDDSGLDSLPPGRFVSGVTQTSAGKVTVIGICIPWFGSRTEARRGSERRRPWQDHEQFLVGLSEILEREVKKRLIVIGDFNQSLGQRSRAPTELRLALENAFSPSMRVATSGLAFQGRPSIDHIALSADWTVGSLGVISNVHGGTELSDHFGVFADVSVRQFQ